MPDYSKGLIYQLCCKNPEITECYVGSTTNKTRRKQEHKSSCNKKDNKQYNHYKYQFIRENGGFENWDLIVIEPFSCNSKTELETRERYWIEKLNSILNSVKRPYTTKEERKIDQQKYDKIKYEKEKGTDKYKAQQKKTQKTYREKHPDKHKKYYEEHKDELKLYIKEYHNKHKELKQQKDKERIDCNVCNCSIRKCDLLRHSKSKKHINNLL